MENTAVQNRERLAEIRALLLKGAIDFDEARAKAKPIIDAMNERGKEIAKSHGMKYKPITFTGIMR